MRAAQYGLSSVCPCVLHFAQNRSRALHSSGAWIRVQHAQLMVDGFAVPPEPGLLGGNGVNIFGVRRWPGLCPGRLFSSPEVANRLVRCAACSFRPLPSSLWLMCAGTFLYRLFSLEHILGCSSRLYPCPGFFCLSFPRPVSSGWLPESI